MTKLNLFIIKPVRYYFLCICLICHIACDDENPSQNQMLDPQDNGIVVDMYAQAAGTQQIEVPLGAVEMNAGVIAGMTAEMGEQVDMTFSNEVDRTTGGSPMDLVDMATTPDPPSSMLAFDPAVIQMSFSQPNEQQTRMLQLVNLGDTPLDLTALYLMGSPTFTLVNAPSLPIRLSPQTPILISLAYVADDEVPDQATLYAETQQGIQASAHVESSIKVVSGTPCLSVTPAQLFFGIVPRGQSATQMIEIASCGTQNVTLQEIRRGVSIFGALPNTFSFTPPVLPQNLMPQQSITLPITYTPQRAGLEGGFVEFVSDDTQTPIQKVDLSAIAEPPPIEEVALHIKLTWDTDLTDVDLHLLGPNGQFWTCEGDCYFSNTNPNWGDVNSAIDDPFLDLDDTDGYGPENINLEAPIAGIYSVWVQYWDDHGGDIPHATIEVYNFGQLMGSYGPVALPQINDVWQVIDITFPGFQIAPINQVQSMPRGPLCTIF